MANSQHRCVFVGNIPYDATEEQLVQICEEVGPVVSFRLVIDRETGKPKGYGFCEYKDEETALSARRNLHGYDINGRQLRVDFAENDKNNDKGQLGHGGPGLPSNTGPQKQIGGPAVQRDPNLHQPVGLQVAMAAAVVMAGQSQTNNNISQNGIQSQPTLGTDPLTLHLAKITKHQLTEVLTELKTMATQNKEQARQLLLAHPQLSKAVLQAHIMLKSVPPHLLQMPNARAPHTHTPLQGGPLGPQSSIQALPGLPPLAQNKAQLGFMPQSQSQPSSTLVPSQYVTPSLPRFQAPVPAQHQVPQHSTLSGLPMPAGNLQSLHPQQTVGLSNRVENQMSNRVENQMATSSSMLQYSGQNASVPAHKAIGSGIPNNGNKDHPQHLPNNPVWGRSRIHENSKIVSERDQNVHPSKLLKMEDGRGTTFSHDHSASVVGPSQPGNQILKATATDSQKPNNQVLPGVEPALLQQVLNLTPEQLSSLPPEQQQQVIQLQQMLRQST